MSATAPRYRALVFDLDGTAMDTTENIPAIGQAYEIYCGRRLSWEDMVTCFGLPVTGIFEFLNIPPEDQQTFTDIFLPLYLQSQENDHLYPGFLPMLEALSQRQVLLGVNTSRTAQEVEDLRAKIPEPFLDYCGQIVTCDRVPNPKPAPDSLLYFCRQTGLQPSQVLYVGDTIFDSQCAQQAGVDFALAMWGTLHPEIPAQYRPQTPEELASVILGE